MSERDNKSHLREEDEVDKEMKSIIEEMERQLCKW